MSLLRELLTYAVRNEASDVHLKTNRPPAFRLHGVLRTVGDRMLSPEEMNKIVDDLVPYHLRGTFDRDHEVDLSHYEPEVGRFRVNVFHSHGAPAVAMRHVKTAIPSFNDLSLPAGLQDLALAPNGIVLVCGTTGSGKSTTLAALIQHINLTLNRRIITIEDPIEFVFADEESIISQREVGLDTPSFHSALKHVLRQDPDVILIGEMRDSESFMAALAAAETGHLFFSTLHTANAGASVSRILDFFPASERDQIRMSLAANIRAVVCQRLVPAIRGGVVPAVEVMVNTPSVRKLIEKSQLEMLPAAIETGADDGMQTFNQCIYQLIKDGIITEEDGFMRCDNPEALRMNLKGIFLNESRRILRT
jgi:twitching motility protein PilT